MSAIFWETLATLAEAVVLLLVPLPFFVLLGFIVKGGQVFSDARRSLPESRTNLLFYFGDALLVAPAVSLLAVAMNRVFTQYDWFLVPAGFWTGISPWLVVIVAIAIGDFSGYWRHRIEHTALFWPTHAVHHSDTEMTWMAVFRIHPFNRFTTTLFDFSILLAMGLPAYAVAANFVFRHYYGALIHADLPWTYGPLGKILVSPSMHRWHHSIDRQAYDTNFATVFSLYDRIFGTYRVPGVCHTALGVPEPMGAGVIGQLTHPLKPSSYRYFVRRFCRLVGLA